MLNSAGDPVFTIAPIEVALDRRLSLEQVRVLLALFSFRDKATGLVFPKRESIASRCGYAPKKISEITSSLVKLGWLVKVGSGGRSSPCQYQLMPPETLTEKVTVNRPKNPVNQTLSGAKSVTDSVTVPEWETVPDSGTVPESETVPHWGDKTVPESGDKTVPEWGTGKEQTSEQTRNRQCVDPPLPPLKPKFDPLLVRLPDCLLPDQWRRWVEYRRSIKKPLSLPTTEAQLRQLVEWHQAGHDPNEILAASVRNSWQGIFKPKSGDTHGTHPRQDNSAVARVERAIRDQEERELRERDGSFVGGHIIDVGREDYQHLAYPQAVEADD